ncbi:BRCA1-associated RING domain protein 1-like [Hetaerina americana]|uniref:BRCA1-associated RING domain protein 1-like n=1 Tax=Hetaerina americana TaxID=62018 RepID=UPI003A7F45F6
MSEPAVILTGPRRKRGPSRNVTLSKKLSTGSLKSVSDTSVNSPSLFNDAPEGSSRKRSNSDIKTPFSSDLDSSLVMVERKSSGGKSRGNLRSGSKGAKHMNGGKTTETSNPDFITPVKNMNKRSSESQIKNVSDTAKKAANKRNAKGETPLQVACKKGNLNQVISLISDGANPNVKDNFGWTPLHEAIHYKHIEIAKELIVKGGAWVNTPGGENCTPLHKAVALNVIEGIKLLLESGANPKLVDIYGNIPVDYSQSDEVSRILENHSADIIQCSLIGPLSKDIEVEEERVVFFGDGLSKNDLKLLVNLSSLIPGSRVSQSFTSDVTHVAVNEENGVCFPSINVLSGILTSKQFVSIECKYFVAFE